MAQALENFEFCCDPSSLVIQYRWRIMNTKSTTTEILNLLVNRIELLNSIDENPKDKRSIVENVDWSRSTVDRGIRELESIDFIRYREGEYKATLFGKLVTSEYNQFRQSLETLLQLRPFLRWIPDAHFEFDHHCLKDATVLGADQSNPYEPANRHADVLETSETFRALIPGIGLHQLETAWEAIQEHSQTQHVIVERKVLETLRSESHYTDLFEALCNTETVEIGVYDGTFPYFLGIYDETVHIGVEDQHGLPRALLETNAEEVMEWATDKFDTYKHEAERIPSPSP